MANRLVDIFLTYQFLKKLTTPFNKWKAYELGIIDENGKVLKKRKDLQTLEEKKAWGYHDIMVANLKKLIEKLPGGKSRIATFAAALLLLREEKITNKEMLEEKLDYYINEVKKNKMAEELPGTNVGGGNVAGLGVGSQGEPGVDPKRKRKKTDLFKRKPV